MNLRQKQWSWLLILTILTGCGSSAPTEASAKSQLETELKKWMAGENSKASTFESRLNLHSSPLSYTIRSAVPTKPKLPIDVMADYPDAIGDDDAPAFRIVVDVVFKSRAGTPLTKVVEYNLTWVEQMGGWAIEEK